MKATGEVMAIAPSFEMALMKAVRGAEIKLDTLNRADASGLPVEERLKNADDLRLFTIFEALKSGVSIDRIHEITKHRPLVPREARASCRIRALDRRGTDGGELPARQEARLSGRRAAPAERGEGAAGGAVVV